MCLVASSVMIWAQGVVFLMIGILLYHILKNFFADGKGLKIAGGFPQACIILAVFMFVITVGVNYVVLYPNPWRFFGVSFALIGLFVFEIIFLAAGYSYLPVLRKILIQGYETAMINYSEGFVTNTELNLLQWMVGCCGLESFQDWYTTSWASGRMEVPESCCIDVRYCHNLEPLMVDDIYKKGCKEKILLIMKSQTITITFIALWSFISLVLGIAVATGLAIKEMRSRSLPLPEITPYTDLTRIESQNVT